MKIIQLIQKPQLRGAEVFAAQLSEHLMGMGHSCKMVTIFPGNAELPFHGEMIHLSRPLNKRLWDWTGWKEFADLVKREMPDVVQANAGDTLKFAILSRLFFKWKTPVIFRNASLISSYIKSPLVLWFNRFLFKRTSFVISVSNHSKQDFLKLFPFMSETIEVIPIGIELSVATKPRNEREYLLHVGGFTFEKNHAGLIRIMKQLTQKRPDLQLWLVGDGPLQEATRMQVAEQGLEHNVKFMGYQHEVMSIMKGARALVLPSKIEGLPGVILEAMYCRTPVVAFNVGGISEVVKNTETGWLVRAGDEEGFVAAIEEVLNAPNLDEIIERAYNNVVTEYDNRVISKRFLKVYEKIC